jgi:crotonobetaine/carnitine-CoA ligase
VDVADGRTLHGILADHAALTPDKTFLVFEDSERCVRKYTFAELDRLATNFADGLEELGLRKGDRINLHLANCPEFLIAWFGAARFGASIVPTNPAASALEWRYVVQHSGAKLALVDVAGAKAIARETDVVRGLRAVVGCSGATGSCSFEDVIATSKRGATASSAVSAADELAIMYTSGTTAHPKGVVLTHANYIYAGEAQGRHISLRPDDRYLVVLPLFHASGQTHATIPALLFGASVALMSRFSASRYFDQVLTHDVTIGSLFGTPIRMILGRAHKAEHRRSRMRLALYAQNLTNEQLDEWEARYAVPLIQIWGMTETMALPIMENPYGIRKRGSMGRPILGYDVAVIDDDGRFVSPGSAGELLVHGRPGRTILREYLDNPEATAATIRDDWLHTGDRVFVDAEGYFFFVDRKKDMIKRSGENIAAAEVEAVLRNHPAVEDAAVVGIPHPVYDEVPKAFVILRAEQSCSAEDLIAWCAERLAAFKVPTEIAFRIRFPRTSVGKVQKKLLQ